MELDALIKVRRDALLRESVSKAEGEIVEKLWTIKMTGGTSLQGRSAPFHIVCHALIPQSSYTRTVRKAGRMKLKSTSGQ
ncbi:hypothetical protein BDR05DRAFT_969783 [Suillus weaverae]|nr:hypothetical protein BDR05DRAFT_969783 [Suillus weaverae]